MIFALLPSSMLVAERGKKQCLLCVILTTLGRSNGSVTAIYNRYGYVKEMRAGLEACLRELTK